MAKDNIHLNFVDDKVFLNFWNWFNGDDVVCEIVGDKIMLLKQYDQEGNDPRTQEITISQFVEMVRTRMKEIMESKF